MKKLLIGITLLTSLPLFSSELCNFAIGCIAYYAKDLGASEIRLVHTEVKIKTLEYQRKVFMENPNMEYSLGSTKEEVELELGNEKIEKDMLKSSISKSEEFLQMSMKKAQDVCN